MALFNIVADSHVILRSSGIWKQTELYERDGILYAKHGSGFIGLRTVGNTTLPKVQWEAIHSPREWKVILLGRLELIPLPPKKAPKNDHQSDSSTSKSPDQGNAPIKASSPRRKPRAK